MGLQLELQGSQIRLKSISNPAVSQGPGHRCIGAMITARHSHLSEGLWSLVLLWICITAAPSECGSVQGHEDFKLCILDNLHFNDAANTYCPFAADMPGTGGNICNLKGQGFLLGSAADLLSASRFMGFRAPSADSPRDSCSLDPGCTVYSTEPHFPWVVADFVIRNQQSMSTVLQKRHVLGTGQLDLFLCSNSECESVLDVQSVALAAGHVLAAGYSQVAGTKLGAPRAYLNATKLLSKDSFDFVPREDLVRALPSKYQEVEVAEIAYKNDGRAWLLRPPALLKLGTFSNAGNVAWEKLRYGTYFATNLGECVGVITPVHDWMNAHGWDQSHQCGKARKVFVFNTYFPQAFLNLTSKRDCVTPSKSDNQSGCRDDVFGPLLSEAPTNNTWDPDFLVTLTSGKDGSKTLMRYGLAVFVDGHGENSMTGTGPYAAGSYWESCGGGPEWKKYPEHWVDRCHVLVIGRAAILAVDLSDDEQGGQVTTDPTDGPRGNYDNQIYNPSEDAYTMLANKLFAELTTRIYSENEVPWCLQLRDGQINYSYYDKHHDVHTNNFRNAWIESREFPPALVHLLDCSMWDEWNFGYVNRSVDYLFGNASVLAENAHSRWFPVNMDYYLGFKGYERLTSRAVNDSVRNMALDAAGKLYEQTSLALSLTDPTITWKGGISLVAMTLVSIVAFNAGREDVEHLIHKGLFRESTSILGRAAAFCLFVIVSLVAIALPAILAVVQEVQTRANSGSSSKVWWLQEQCFGYGRYTMLGALTMSFSPVFDEVGYGFLWLNLVLALAGAVYVFSRSKHDPMGCLQRMAVNICYPAKDLNKFILRRSMKGSTNCAESHEPEA
eukprot:jgi/Botrbrau1/14056/Bobra.182_3s0003.1